MQIKHLIESNLKYGEHLVCALWFALLHAMVVPVAVLHGFFPFILGGLGKKLHARIMTRYNFLVWTFQDSRNLKKNKKSS